MQRILKAQEQVLKVLSGKMDGFYLAGGTALSNYHFQHHRESYDLDFFSQKYDPAQVDGIAAHLESRTRKKMKVAVREEGKKKFADIRRYDLAIDRKNALRIDFVRDVHDLLEPLMEVNGIPVLSLADIYLRKIFAVTGVIAKPGVTGRTVTEGGRQTARDLFDLYHLSLRAEPLASFAQKHCDDLRIEGLCNWFRSFDRTAIKIELAEIRTSNPVEFREIDRYFAREIERLYGGLF
ncbi:MAG TPA: nucleotidyl transferase AbiEii/AbiGii toxin family protein [Candidatus Omnitrophota bacterium]|nr:nucleotidyl transferase AbiEii/AbiGii toxin family protein [Candidatus Omnitrophota bacterium]